MVKLKIKKAIPIYITTILSFLFLALGILCAYTESFFVLTATAVISGFIIKLSFSRHINFYKAGICYSSGFFDKYICIDTINSISLEKTPFSHLTITLHSNEKINFYLWEVSSHQLDELSRYYDDLLSHDDDGKHQNSIIFSH